MIGIIAYGSLINPQETQARSAGLQDVIPVRVEAYARIFQQRPSWRTTTGADAAVLNARRSASAWLNAVCCCYDAFSFAELDRRERGYDRKILAPERLSRYDGRRLPRLEQIYIYLGKAGHQDNNLRPHPEYLELCLSGARHWGKPFYDDFLTTTRLGNGILLRDYLAPSPTPDRP